MVVVPVGVRQAVGSDKASAATKHVLRTYEYIHTYFYIHTWPWFLDSFPSISKLGWPDTAYRAWRYPAACSRLGAATARNWPARGRAWSKKNKARAGGAAGNKFPHGRAKARDWAGAAETPWRR